MVIKYMLEIYNSEIPFTEKELDKLVEILYQDVEDTMYQASNDVIIDYSDKYLKG